MRVEELCHLVQVLLLPLVHVDPRLVQSADTEVVQTAHHRQQCVVAVEAVEVLCVGMCVFGEAFDLCGM